MKLLASKFEEKKFFSDLSCTPLVAIDDRERLKM